MRRPAMFAQATADLINGAFRVTCAAVRGGPSRLGPVTAALDLLPGQLGQRCASAADHLRGLYCSPPQ